MKKIIKLLPIVILMSGIVNIHAQQSEVIYLKNPSFEGFPRPGTTPDSWADCGHSQESPPDIQPHGGFSVTRLAYDGRTYVGLVSRENKTWEAIAQRLSKNLKKGTCYKFSLYACKSPIYISPTKKNQNQPTNFNKGLIIRIWGGNNFCDRSELLDEIKKPIEHLDWKNYKFEFTPKKDDYSFICIEAYYKTPTFNYYNGNVLIDNASEIFSCEIPTDIILEDNVKDTIKKTNDTLLVNNINPEELSKSNEPNPNISTNNITIIDKGNFNANLIVVKDLKIGYKFRLDNLNFQADSSSISLNGKKALSELYQFLKANPNIALEIGGHTNGLPKDAFCDELSTKRAKNVVNFLQEEGIDPKRMSYHGYGKRKPIGDNATKEGQKKNQRVEFIITDLKNND
ncbi:MAG: OmpA family protein [Saprospiraceae bacterium]|nr:OmpA family protein [Saprospiraceae bacterium]